MTHSLYLCKSEAVLIRLQRLGPMQLMDPKELATLDVKQLDCLVAAVNAEVRTSPVIQKHLQDKATETLNNIKAQGQP